VIMIPDRHGQTDGQTDGRSDRRFTVASLRSVLASRGKNHQYADLTFYETIVYVRKSNSIFNAFNIMLLVCYC